MEGEVSEFWNPKECTLPIVQKRWMVGTKKDVPTACVGMLFGPNDAETNGKWFYVFPVLCDDHVPCAMCRYDSSTAYSDAIGSSRGWFRTTKRINSKRRV